MQRSVTYMQLTALGMMIAMTLGLSLCPTHGLAQSVFNWQNIFSVSAAPNLQSIEPEIIGVGGKVRLRGQNLGNTDNSVVVFHPGIVADKVEKHTPNEVVVRVPIGATTGSVRVVTGVEANRCRELQAEISRVRGTRDEGLQQRSNISQHHVNSLLGAGSSSNPFSLKVTIAFIHTNRTSGQYVEGTKVRFLRNRIIVDLRDFHGFETALEIADRMNADLMGYFPVTNSYVIDYRLPPKDLNGFEYRRRLILRDPRVSDVWEDVLLSTRSEGVKFANTDVIHRYRITRLSVHEGNLLGRVDVWATDRIQAPGGWNLIERHFTRHEGCPAGMDSGRACLYDVKVAVADSGCVQTHPDLRGVDLRRVETIYERVRIAGRMVVLPSGIDDSQPYTGGDSAPNNFMHGTGVVSLLGARNENAIVANDRGINGLLHNPMRYTIQVHQSSMITEAGDSIGVTTFLAAINMAAKTHARVLNCSFGSHDPLGTSESLRRALRKVAHQLQVFSELLLVVAAGNEGNEIQPFDPATFTGGNDLCGSLGTLPNVISVGAIDKNDQRAHFSNWGPSVNIAAPGVDVFVAGGYNTANPNNLLIGGALYNRASGTSFATPLVSGTAALLLAIHPLMTPAQLKSKMQDTSMEVETTTPSGSAIVWKTLKTGYAVRRVLMENHVIGNDQPWTGVSKIVVTTQGNGPMNYRLGLLETRRGSDGRPEGFAFRELSVNDSLYCPTLTHDGWWYAYYAVISGPGGGIHLKKHDFTTNNTSTLDSAIGQDTFGFALNYSPSDVLAYSYHRVDALNGRHAYELWQYTPAGLISRLADSNWQEVRHHFRLNHISWRPDNLHWTLDYTYEDTSTPQSFKFNRLWSDYPDITLSITIPPISLQFSYVSVSPDGFARAWIRGSDLLTGYVSRYTTIVGIDDRQNRGPLDPFYDFRLPPERGLCWSPDGSTVAYSFKASNDNNAASIRIISRDLRGVSFRENRPMFTLNRQNALLGTLSWQW